MKQKMLSKKKYSPKCANCFYGRTPKDNSDVICEKKGFVSPDDSCRHYKYDPLKRVPQKIVINTGFTPEDFEI